MEKNPRKSLPQWVVIVVLLLTILGSVFVGWWYIAGGSRSQAQVVIAEGPDPNTLRDRGFRFWADGVVHYADQNTIIARKGSYSVRAQYDRDPRGPWRLSLDFSDSRSWLTPEQTQVEDYLRRAVGGGPGRGDSLNLTQEQRRQLQAIPSRVELSSAEKSTIEPLMKKWKDAKEADRPPIALALQSATEAAGNAHVAEAKALASRRAGEIAKVLTPEQYAKAKQPQPSVFGRMFGGGSGGSGRPPTTRPSRQGR